MANRNWTREEMILALNLYLKLPFGRMHRNNNEVVHLANLIKRTPSAVAMRLSNFASVDPYHQARGITGLTGGVNQCKPYWDEFTANREDLLFESERILSKLENQDIEIKYNDSLKDISNLKGETRVREVKTRVNQAVFRHIVLNNYNKQCAITGIDIPEFLVASHIIPWSISKEERLNPSNGICLSSLYDKAYDQGFIGISTKYEVILSKSLQRHSGKVYYKKFFSPLIRSKLHLPERYLPRKEFLEYHLENIFI